MSLRSYYQTLELYRHSAGDWENASGYALEQTFKGIVQAPSNSNTFTNSKDTSDIDGVLFTDVAMNGVITEKDKIKQPDGKTYIVSGAGSQPKGVTGIRNHHIEFALVFDNDS